MPVRADELDARPADNAKELLALADKLDNSRHLDCFDEAMVVMTLAERDLVISALRLCARQQASVESIRRTAQSRADFWREQSTKTVYRSTHYKVIAGQFQNIADALAKYDIFEKVEG